MKIQILALLPGEGCTTDTRTLSVSRSLSLEHDS